MLAIVLFASIGTGGVFLLRLASGLRSDAEIAAAWTRTDARLVELSIRYTPSVARGDHTSYTAFARYVFDVNGREVTGRGMFGPDEGATLDGLKDLLKPWLNDPYAIVSEHPDSWGEVFTYRPIAETVPAYYDPADPTQSYFGTPSADGSARVTASVFAWGMLLIGWGGVAVIVYSAFDDRRHAREVEHRQQADRTAAAKGHAAPSTDDTREFTQLAVVAIRAIEDAMALDPAFNRLDGVLGSLRTMRDQPADALTHTANLGFTRWLSGEWNLETWGEPGVRVLAAVNALESFHDRWRAASRTRVIAV